MFHSQARLPFGTTAAQMRVCLVGEEDLKSPEVLAQGIKVCPAEEGKDSFVRNSLQADIASPPFAAQPGNCSTEMHCWL